MAQTVLHVVEMRFLRLCLRLMVGVEVRLRKGEKKASSEDFIATGNSIFQEIGIFKKKKKKKKKKTTSKDLIVALGLAPKCGSLA